MIKNFIAGIVDIAVFLIFMYFLLYLPIHNLTVKQIISSIFLIIYLGFIPYKYQEKTLGEMLVDIPARINIPEYIKTDSEIARFYVLLMNRIVLLLFDLFGINIIKAILKSIFRKKEEKKF